MIVMIETIGLEEEKKEEKKEKKKREGKKEKKVFFFSVPELDLKSELFV